MRPVHRASLSSVPRTRRRLDEECPPDFLVTIRRKARDDQLAAVIVDEVTVSVTHDHGRRPPGLLARDFERLPDPGAGPRVDASELAVAANAVDEVAIHDGRGDQRVKTVRIDFAPAVPSPEHPGSGGRPFELEHHRAVVE